MADKGTFGIRVAFDGEPSAATSQRLDELRAKLAENDLSGDAEKKSAQGKGDLTVWIQLAGLGLSAIGTVVSVLTYWRKSKPETPPPTITIIYVEQRVTLEEGDDPDDVAKRLRLDESKGGELIVDVTE